MTVGTCSTCGQLLIHCWVGGVVGGVYRVTQEVVDGFLVHEGRERKRALAEWFESRQ